MSQIDHYVKQLRQLAFCLDTFVIGSRVAGEYLSSYDSLSDLARSAFTRSVLVDYASVFMKNTFDDDLKGFISTKFLTKSETFDKDFHDALMEVRHNLVAHKGYQSPGLGVKVATVKNSTPRTHQNEKVSAPIQYFLQNQSMGYIRSGDTIQKIVGHLKECEQLTMRKASELVDKLRDLLLADAPTLDKLDFVESLPVNGNSYAAKDEKDDLSIETKTLDDLKIGKDNVQFLLTRMRMDRSFQGDYISKKGYRITSNAESGEITISFLANNTRPDKEGWLDK